MHPSSSLLLLATVGALFLAPAQGQVFVAVTTVSLASGLSVLMWAGRRPERQGVAHGWALLVSAHVLLGMGLELYETSLLYDKLVHVAAFVWVAACLLPRTSSAVMTALAATGLGAGWELFEFLADQGGWFVAQKGLNDTMLDLLCDALGASIGAALATSVANRSARPLQESLQGSLPDPGPQS